MNKNFKLYWTLFTSTFVLSAFTVGGGYVIVPLMQKKFSEQLKWISNDEIIDIASLAQAAPGPIAVNAAMLIGYKTGSVLGAFVTVLGTVLPPLIIMAAVSFFYTAFITNAVVAAVLKGIRAGVAAVMVDAVISMAQTLLKKKSSFNYIVLIIAFLLSFVFNINSAYIILGAGILGYVYYTIMKKREKVAK
ncbi:MAG: chromate transporter [Bacillota bacterium]|nr:chromate transporter [Bacillota bacterium]